MNNKELNEEDYQKLIRMKVFDKETFRISTGEYVVVHKVPNGWLWKIPNENLVFVPMYR